MPVVVLPSCARSSRTNGLDCLLHRLLARLPLSGRDIMGMGVGGLIRSPAEAAEAPQAGSASAETEPAGLYIE